jgi:hypothetical protein
MTLAVMNSNFQRVGAGQLYLAPAPSADPGAGTLATTADGYYGLFYQDAGIKKVLKAGVNPYANLTANGITFKVKPSTVEFDYNNGPKNKVLSGIDEATTDFEFWDVDPAHLKDVFGMGTSDLIAVAAAAGKAGRKIVALGASTNYGLVTAMYKMASVLVPGEFDHFLFPLAALIPEIDVKLSKKEGVNIKVSMSLRPSPYAFNSLGNGVVAFNDSADAAAL